MPHSQPGPLPPSGCTEPLLGTPPCRVVSLAPSTLLQCPEEGDALQGDGADSSCACPSLPRARSSRIWSEYCQLLLESSMCQAGVMLSTRLCCEARAYRV